MKRGESGLSLVLGLAKPRGMSSHDVVNRVRRIFGERRVGHAGTLDPMAEGALCVCVGPATRLNPFLSEHDKRYCFVISFGIGTDTDDASGQVIQQAAVPSQVYDENFAARFVAGLVGKSQQIPPAYSAIKVEGQRSYHAARSGNAIELAARDIQIYEAQLCALGSDEAGNPTWELEVHVSKGTYIRSLARDIGAELGVPAHVSRLIRTQAGALALSDCLPLELLEEHRERAVLDPVRLLGLRFAYLEGKEAQAASHGTALEAGELTLFERRGTELFGNGLSPEDCCTSGVQESAAQPKAGELVSLISENRLCAIYEYDDKRALFKARCVFSTGVARG